MLKQIALIALIALSEVNGGYLNTEKYSGIIANKTVDLYYDIEPEIYYATESYNVPFWLVASILFTESRFDNKAVSWTKVSGIGQITKNTAKRYDIDKSTIAGQIDGVAKILRDSYDNLPKYYSDNTRWMLSSIFFSSGKRDYFKSKKYWKKRGVTGSKITIDRILKFYRLQGKKYYKKVLKAKPMFL